MMEEKKVKYEPNSPPPGSKAGGGGGANASSRSSTITSSTGTSSRRANDRFKPKNTVPTSIDTFKGDNISLQGKVFTVGADQAARFDKTMKAILGYVADKFDHRVTVAIRHKDKSVAKLGLGLTK